MKLPPIEYFYGNTPMSLWISRCKPFNPSPTLPFVPKYIESVISPKLLELIHQMELLELKRYKIMNEILCIKSGNEGTQQ